jgi:hypothetical protein
LGMACVSAHPKSPMGAASLMFRIQCNFIAFSLVCLEISPMQSQSVSWAGLAKT